MGCLPRVLIALALAAPLVADAQSHARADEAMAALRRNDCDATLAALRQGMLDNEPQSFFVAGNLDETGTCVADDPTEAAKAYERAALMGHPDAAAALAVLYAEGSGVEQSYRDAGRWYAIARSGSAAAVPDASPFASPDAVAKTYVRAVHDLAAFELANRLKYPYPVGARVRFDPRTGVATVVARTGDAGPRPIADNEILASYREALRLLPKPDLPASGDYATERPMGSATGAP